jgi:nitrate/nitrite transport system ATP-binding protein
MSLLSLQGVGKGYGEPGKRTEVLRNINLEIEPGELVVIVGYSGAGKTTLVSMMAGLIPADTGMLLFDGKPITKPGAERGVVFQNYSLLPWLTVFENVHLAVEQVFPSWSQQKKKEHCERYLAMVSLSHALDKRPAQLSGGMRQRVSVARALAMEPAVLLMDEPFGALDALTRATLQDELARISAAANTTMLLITNDVEEAMLLGDRIVPLGAGPNASLGPSFAIEMARPRSRKDLQHDPRFKELRTQIVDYLLGSAKAARSRKDTALQLGAVKSTLEPAR